MKKHIWIIAVIAAIVCAGVFVGCGLNYGALNFKDNGTDGLTSVSAADASAYDSVFDGVKETAAAFAISTDDGEYTRENEIYTISKGGTYTISGALAGQIVVNAPEEEVEIGLNGAAIVCSFDSPIKIVAADKVEISAKKDTENVVKDTRGEKTIDDETQGAGAIYAKSDLKLKGNGVLVIEACYKNGVHTTDDLTIKNLFLKVTAVDNAVKGNDSVTVESGTIVAISLKGDGVKTENTDISSKGKQRGTVTVSDGTVAVFAAGDGIQAGYDFNMDGGSLAVYTGSYSAYTASGATTTSYKGVKVGNELKVTGGVINIRSYDDGLHADHGAALENGETGKGNINISGGETEIGVYSPAKSTPNGRMGPGGWGNQQTVNGSDAIHADNTLTVSGGTINIDSAYEGLEASFIVINGGKTFVYATDDGVNACKKITDSPSVLVSGGYLFVAVPSDGDTDGIDSNGTYKQTGGTVIACGPGSVSGGRGGGAWALDTDRGVTLQGGTLILFGGMENIPSAAGMTRTVCSSTTVSSGQHTVTAGGESYTVNLKYAAGGCVVYSAAGKANLK